MRAQPDGRGPYIGAVERHRGRIPAEEAFRVLRLCVPGLRERGSGPGCQCGAVLYRAERAAACVPGS